MTIDCDGLLRTELAKDTVVSLFLIIGSRHPGSPQYLFPGAGVVIAPAHTRCVLRDSRLAFEQAFGVLVANAELQRCLDGVSGLLIAIVP